MKYNKMVEMSKKKSQQNIKAVEREIEKMLKQGELIKVSELAQRTGFSSSFYYKNEHVRKLIEQAKNNKKMCLKAKTVKYIFLKKLRKK